jgi:hypothetical protein
MEVGECKQLCKRGRRQKLWEEEKDLRKKGILSLIVVFSASPGLLRNLLSSDDLLRLPSAPSSLPLARPPSAPIVCIIHRSPPLVFDQGWHHRRLSCSCVVITYGCCDCATTTNTALLRGLWSCAGSCMHEWHFLRLLLSLSLSRIVSPPQLLRSLLTTCLAGPQQPANSRRDSHLKSRHHPRLRRLPLSRNPKTFHPNLSLSFFVSVKTSVVVRVFGGSSQVLVTCFMLRILRILLDAIVIRIGLDCGTNLLLIQFSNQNHEKKHSSKEGQVSQVDKLIFVYWVYLPFPYLIFFKGTGGGFGT